MLRHFLLLSLTMILFAAPLAHAEEKDAKESTEAEIHQAIAALQESFNSGNAKNLAACWTADGEFVGPSGDRIVGREKIEGAFREFLATHPDSKLRLGIASWRPMADDVALVDLLTEMTPVPEGLQSEPTSTAVLVKRDGRWLIGSMYETFSNVPPHRTHLKKLQWLVGDWAEEAGDLAGVSVRSECDWNHTGTYMIRKFSAERPDVPVLAGTEVIGWDPRTHRIRSWTFNSDGSFGKSTWTRDGSSWIIDHTGTLTDGGDLSVTYVVTLIDADTLTVKSKGRMINGQPQPPLPEVKLKRLPAKKAPESKPIEPPKQVLP